MSSSQPNNSKFYNLATLDIIMAIRSAKEKPPRLLRKTFSIGRLGRFKVASKYLKKNKLKYDLKHILLTI